MKRNTIRELALELKQINESDMGQQKKNRPRKLLCCTGRENSQNRH